MSDDDYPYTRTRDIVAKDIAEHEITIVKDEELYRHVRFRRPGDSFYWFDLVTWPGILVINGDCGTYVFSRVTDMFTFFRHDAINPRYWAEKLQAPKSDGVEHFSKAEFDKGVEYNTATWAEHYGVERDLRRYDLDEDEGAYFPLRSEWEFRRDFSEHMRYVDDYEHPLREAQMSFKFDGEYPFSDAWENTYTAYDYQYLWCCWAIVFGIRMYDEFKTEQERQAS